MTKIHDFAGLRVDAEIKTNIEEMAKVVFVRITSPKHNERMQLSFRVRDLAAVDLEEGIHQLFAPVEATYDTSIAKGRVLQFLSGLAPR